MDGGSRIPLSVINDLTVFRRQYSFRRFGHSVSARSRGAPNLPLIETDSSSRLNLQQQPIRF